MIPDTRVTTVERCAGHDGTWGVKAEYFENSMKIGRPVFRQMAEPRPRLRQLRLRHRRPPHPAGDGRNQGARNSIRITLVRIAYGL